MGALEQGLQLATPLEASAAPASPATRAPPPIKAPGALGRALEITSTAQQAVAADPMAAQMASAIKQDAAAREQTAKAVEANMARKAEILATPDPARPAVPRLTPLPEAPEPVKRDPLRVFGQFLPMIAALGAVATKQPAVNALNAATAMVNAAKNNDKEETDRQRQSWLQNLQATVQGNNQILGEYRLALEDRNATVAEKMARVQAIAAQNQDLLTLATLRSGNLESMSKLLSLRNEGVKQLADVANTVMDEQFRRDKMEQDRLYQLASLEIDRRRAANVSMGDAVGPILLKIQQAGPAVAGGLDQVLTPGEIAALKTYMDINASRQFNNQPGTAPATGAGLIPGVGGSPATPVAPGAPAPAANVTPVPENVYAARVAQAKAALARNAPRDSVKAVWVQSGLPAEEFDKRVR